MCLELCSAKMLSPFFGTSIYVWAAVLGITLTALMSGYYLGGYISAKYQHAKTIFWLMLAGGTLLTLTPIISSFLLPITIHLNLLLGSILSLLGFMFIPLFLFGSLSPLIINYLTHQAKDSGKSSGTVYAISTLGGIITTFLVGFYTLPEYGITSTLYAYGILVMAVATYSFIHNRTFKTPVAIVIILAALSANFHDRFHGVNTLYTSDGILGQIKVIERPHFDEKTQQTKVYRELLVNNISQTIMDINRPDESYWDYVDILMNNINAYKKGNQTLLLGLGGGTLFRQLQKQELEVEVVEIDARIETLAKDFFYIDPSTEVVIDDARHYLNTNHKKYDIIIYDLYHSETPPVHLMTQEAFTEIKSILNPNGLLIINFYGYITGDKGKGARSIYKTLAHCGYDTHLIATPGEESYRNLLFINSPTPLPAATANSACIQKSSLALTDAYLLSDDRLLLEHIYLEAALEWRKNYNEFNTIPLLN